MKVAWRLLGVAIVAVSIVYFVRHALRHWHEIPAIEWSGPAVLSFAVATALNCLVVLLGGLGWYAFLAGAGERIRFRLALVVFALSQFAKYLPGNVVHLLGRVALARVYSLGLPRVVFSMVLEMGWNIAAGAVLALAALGTSGAVLPGAAPLPAAWKIVVVGAVAVVAPLAAIWVFRRVRPPFMTRFMGGGEIAIPSLRVLWGCFAVYLAAFLAYGAMADLLAVGMFGAERSHLLQLTGATAVAVLAGLLTPGAPAGLGVREAVFVALLEPMLGAGAALGISVTFRLVTLVGDGLAFAGALAGRRAVAP